MSAMNFSLVAKAAFISATVIGLAIVGCSSTPTTPGKTCAGAESICNNECIDTQTDPNHCGACETACKSGEVCNAGACALSCGAGSTQCGGGCFDTKVDPKNCGACGTACNAGQVCNSGACSAQCPPQQTLCVADGGAVSCVTTTTDTTNCGSCGNTCDAGKVCSAGKCADTCGTGEQLCKTDGGAPYCAAVLTDNNNCGACGNPCGNGQVCSNGKCQGNCGLNEKLCSGQDGGAAYCAKTDTDQANCGACGTVCTNGQICVASKCQLQCGPGLTACQSNQCVDLKYDRDNCNACGKQCASGLVCGNGVCTASLCGNNVIDVGERCDGTVGVPSGGQITCRPPGSKNECKFDFSKVPQLYCNGGCSWTKSAGCDQSNADIYCKLIVGSKTSTASAFTIGTAQAVPGFSCPLGSYGTNYGTMPEYNVLVPVWYQGTSILANHGAGQIIAAATCTP